MNTQTNNTANTNQGREIIETRYYNMRGHQMESLTNADANGKTWQIHTSKGRNGVTCTAIEGENQGTKESSMFSYEMFGAKRLNLAALPGACTEKKVREVHALGLIEFQKQMNSSPADAAPAYVVTVGQVIRTEGPFESKKRVIYEVTRPGHYKTVTLDGLELRQDDRVKDIKDKFGIGAYYKQGETLPASEIAALVESAKKATADREEAARQATAKAHTEREERINKGREIVKSIPADAECVIVARLREDESDPQSDYHGYKTLKTVYLGYSNHKRDLFPEMRKAAENFTETQHLGTGKGIFSAYVAFAGENGENYEIAGRHHYGGQKSPWHSDLNPAGTFETMAAAQAFTESTSIPQMEERGKIIPLAWKITETNIEHREKYSMGAGYYLGESKYSGWIVSKQSLPTDIKQRAEMLETLQEAAGAGAYFIPEEGKQAKADTRTQTTHTPGPKGDVSIIDYSEKAIAVIGDTKPIKDDLKALGGKFNFRLTCGPGWIFSKRKLEEVKTFLSNYAETPEEVQEEQTEEAAQDWRKHKDLPHDHPLNLCDPQGGQYKQALKEHQEQNPGPEVLALPPAAENGNTPEPVKEMTFDTWKEQYKPIQNPAGDDSGPYDGCLFEDYGTDLNHVQQFQESRPAQVWTLVEVEGINHISAGYKRVNRLGFFITELPTQDQFLNFNAQD